MAWNKKIQKAVIVLLAQIGPLYFLMLPQTQGQQLDTLLSLLPANNPQLKALQLEYQAALQIAPQASQLADPSLKLGWYALPPETRLGPQNLWLIFNQQLPWPGLLNAKHELFEAKARPLLERVAVQKLILERSLKKSWLKGYQIGKEQEIIVEHLDIYSSWEALALNRLENDQASAVDVYQVQLQKKELEQRIEQLEIEKAIPNAEINRLLNRAPNAEVTMQGFLGIPELPLNLEALLSRIGADHPMLKIYEFQKEIAQQNLALNRLEEKPDFIVGLDYFLVSKRTDANPVNNGRDILMPHVAVQVPLNRKKYRAKEQEEELKIQALDQRATDQINAFRAMVETALTNYRKARSEIDFIDEQVSLLRTTLRIAQTDYSNDKRSFDELLQLQDRIITFQERHLAALLTMHLSIVELQFYLLFE